MKKKRKRVSFFCFVSVLFYHRCDFGLCTNPVAATEGLEGGREEGGGGGEGGNLFAFPPSVTSNFYPIFMTLFSLGTAGEGGLSWLI